MTNNSVQRMPWTVLEVAAGLGEERARELLGERLELIHALRQFMSIGHGNSMDFELQHEAHKRARELLTRIGGMS